MPKLKEGTIWPTPEEDAAITAAALSDPDNPPISDEEWETIKPRLRFGGRPKALHPKVQISLRVSPDVIEHFRATGKGWQTRIDNALKEWIAEHPQG